MRLSVIVAVSLALSTAAAAQTVESPVPFDSAGRVMAVTASLAERLRHAAG